MGESLAAVTPGDVLHKRVLSGLGEEIGVVVSVETYPDGEVRKLLIYEDGLPHLREVPARYVKTLGPEVRLKGPREGFHITRLGQPLLPPALFGRDEALAAELPKAPAPPGTVRETL